MRAILLAAGFGIRLRPLTNTIPKCLVPIQGKPLLQGWLDQLSSAGVGPFLINTHYLSEKVKVFIEKSPYKNDVTIKHEKTLKGTAGTLIYNQDFFDGEDGLLIHADNYCLENFSAFIEAHNNRPNECVITMMVFSTDEPSSCGIVELDNRGVVVSFHEKVQNAPGNLANGAVYILSKEFVAMLNLQFINAKDFSLDILPKLVNRIYTYRTKNIFLDIGTPKNYQKISEFNKR
jgi:mannose-1-phosphate guanylyltransferase